MQSSYMILGGQWGSEGKGLFAGYMARERKPDGVVSQFGPNAGHTWIEGDTPIVFKALPVGSIAPTVKSIFLGPGSVIDHGVLRGEIEKLKPLLKDKTIYVHEAAAIIEPMDAQAERANVIHIASTMQGTSEAMIRKIRRNGAFPSYKYLNTLPVVVLSHNMYRYHINEVVNLQIEGSQGMDLSINVGHSYPFVTSRDCTPSQVLADCGLHPTDLTTILACIRTYPIRVGNVTIDGKTLGISGPCYGDQQEMTWEGIGQEKEYTTVTKRVRRVFTFSRQQMTKLVQEVRPNSIMLNFCNYLPPDQVELLVKSINAIAGRDIVRWLGYGPRHTDVKYRIMERNIKPPVYQE